jgi:isopentenyl-diphosphate delta-isomerase
MIEVVDEKNKPFGVLSVEQVHTLQLYHRRVSILLYNKDNKLFLQQRSSRKERYPGFWDLSASSHVLIQESREDAIRRKIHNVFGFYMEHLSLFHEFSPTLIKEFEFISLYKACLYRNNISLKSREIQSGVFVEQAEFEYLLNSFSDLFTPELRSFGLLGYLFE